MCFHKKKYSSLLISNNIKPNSYPAYSSDKCSATFNLKLRT